MSRMSAVPPPLPIPPSRRREWIAWAVIAASAFILFWHANWRAPGDNEEAGPPVVSAQMLLEGRITLGARAVLPAEDQPPLPDRPKDHADAVAADILTAAVKGQPEGLKKLEETSKRLPAMAGDARLAEAYLTGTSAILSKAERDDFTKRYGWFAQLAAAEGRGPEDEKGLALRHDAGRTVVVSSAAGMAGVLAMMTGAVLVLIGGAWWWRHRSPLPRAPRAAPEFVEAAAIYLGCMSGLAFIDRHSTGGMALTVVPMVAGLLGGLFWPRLRGCPWAEWRRILGISWGRGVFREVGWGFVGYVAGLPLIGLAMFLSAILAKSVDAHPSHPAVEGLLSGAIPGWVIFALAAVWAPVTEELMFRGALLTSLRRHAAPVIASVLSSLIFAAVHPQGWTYIPVLGALGFIFATMRQWRGTLIPSMTAHALNNGMLVGFLCLMR